MNNIDRSYQNLMRDITENGTVKKDRTGVGTTSVFGRLIRHDMKEGFPLLTTKKMFFRGIVAELLWFLEGDTDIRTLWKNKVHIWDLNWYQKYEKSCSSPYSLKEMIEYGLSNKPNNFDPDVWDCGPIYGKQWVKWQGFEQGWIAKTYNETPEIDFPVINQIANLIHDLKNNPDSRRLMVTAWNPSEIKGMALPPCHYGFQCWTRELTRLEKIDWLLKNKSKQLFKTWPVSDHKMLTLKEVDDRFPNMPQRALKLEWNQRSVDTFLGLPFNIASYALLLEVLAKECNMVAEELIGSLGDTHLYLNHHEAVEEQLENEPMKLPTVKINDFNSLEDLTIGHFVLEDYESHGKIKANLNE